MDNNNNGYLIEAEAHVQELYRELSEIRTSFEKTGSMLATLMDKIKLIQKRVEEECSE